jgi:hypothetical protein
MVAVFRNNFFIAPEENMFILSPQAGKKEIFSFFMWVLSPVFPVFCFGASM